MKFPRSSNPRQGRLGAVTGATRSRLHVLSGREDHSGSVEYIDPNSEMKHVDGDEREKLILVSMARFASEAPMCVSRKLA